MSDTRGTIAPRKHLFTADSLARAARTSRNVDLTRARGQGNGLRVHAVLFGLMSSVVLVAFIGVIAFASSRM